MKPIYFLPFLSLLLLAPTSGNAAGSMLRISCEGDDVGAEVLINGKFRGECPIDLQVPAGSLKLLVRKKAGAQPEQAFEQEIRMAEGSVKKIEVNLGLAALQKEAAAGNAEAMYKLADLYFRGKNGAPKNDELGLTWTRKAAEAGNIHGMLTLGNVYMFGREGYPQSDDESLRWFRRAAERGDHHGMFWVGYYYKLGKGVPKSEEDAIAWWRKAVEGKDPDSQAAKELKERGLR